MKVLTLMLLHPRRGTVILSSRPKWLVQFPLLALLSIGITLLIHSYLTQLTLAHLPSSATNLDKLSVEQMLHHELGLRCAFLPFRLLIGWISFTFTLYYICKVSRMQIPVRFTQLFSVEVYAETVMIFAQLAAALRISLFDGDHFSTPFPIPLGLDAFVHTHHNFVLLKILNSINLFTFWYLAIVICGVRALYKFRTFKSSVVVLTTWGISTMFNASVLWLLRDKFHFNI
ncbi:MAG: YIP1 family protein [Ignavibacteriae bacterium]|nr:YIP1 family protein [Ignavibacteriota bacterium]